MKPTTNFVIVKQTSIFQSTFSDTCLMRKKIIQPRKAKQNKTKKKQKTKQKKKKMMLQDICTIFFIFFIHVYYTAKAIHKNNSQSMPGSNAQKYSCWAHFNICRAITISTAY